LYPNFKYKWTTVELCSCMCIYIYIIYIRPECYHQDQALNWGVTYMKNSRCQEKKLQAQNNKQYYIFTLIKFSPLSGCPLLLSQVHKDARGFNFKIEMNLLESFRLFCFQSLESNVSPCCVSKQTKTPTIFGQRLLDYQCTHLS